MHTVSVKSNWLMPLIQPENQHSTDREKKRGGFRYVACAKEGKGLDVYCGEYFKRMHHEEELWVHYSTDIYLQNHYSCRKTISVTSSLNSETVFITAPTARAFVQCSFILWLYHWHYYYYCTVIHMTLLWLYYDFTCALAINNSLNWIEIKRKREKGARDRQRKLSRWLLGLKGTQSTNSSHASSFSSGRKKDVSVNFNNNIKSPSGLKLWPPFSPLSLEQGLEFSSDLERKRVQECSLCEVSASLSCLLAFLLSLVLFFPRRLTFSSLYLLTP